VRAAKVNRWFLRCLDCLSIAATDQDPQYMAMFQGVKLGTTQKRIKCECGGVMQLMGRVQRSGRLMFEEERCACDSRCTHATGPNCECSCNGANHGTGRMRCVSIDAGGLPVVQGADLKVAQEFRAAVEAARARFMGLPFYAEFMAGTFIPRDAWDRLRDEQRALSAARHYKTHGRRLKALNAVAMPKGVAGRVAA
jgi:hypothetical protein